VALPFAYYSRLTPRQKEIYRRSDAVVSVPLPDAGALAPLVAALAEALAAGLLRPTQQASAALADGILDRLRLPRLVVRVYAVRPSRTWGELHGLYEPAPRGGQARVSLWMRTAQRRRPVAFRTFLRTHLHEIGHHLDYELLRLPDSFHTEGFYKRESSLFHQLVASREPEVP
jgi:hypothetical protein